MQPSFSQRSAPKPESLDVFVASAAYTSVTLSATPGTAQLVQVYRNGMLMAPTLDYTIAGQVVTFTAAQGTAAGDVVQARYGQ